MKTIKEVAEIVHQNAEIGNWEAFQKCIAALLELDTYYYAAYPELRKSILERIREMQEEQNIFKHEYVKQLVQVMFENVYYVHPDFEEDESDLELYSYLAEQDL